ncbi:MAG: hypothetical protein HY763_00175 [Planctomycetes bacterium]|nr:hypothetical protein [Planctomycetota bacterium]
MITSVHDWLVFLKTSDRLIGLPLLVGGGALIFFGWRMWKVCVVLSFALIGAGVSATLTEGDDHQAYYSFAAAIILGALSYYPASHAVALLGGIIGGGLALHFLGASGLSGTAYWVGGLVALIAATAYALINRRLIVIFVTACLGAVLLVSGLTVFVMLSPPLYGTILSMASGSAVVVPFILLVPTVMSCFYQVAEVHRLQAEL